MNMEITGKRGKRIQTGKAETAAEPDLSLFRQRGQGREG